jgi:AcrR family transcriptional regulator
VLRATLEVLADEGWQGLQIDAVAERAGVHKTTIYRRWQTRGALVAAALAATPFRSHGATSPDTGTVRGDLAALADDMEDVLSVPRTRRIIRSLLAAASDPEVGAANAAFYTVRLDIAAQVIRRGIERGEIPADTDVELIATLFVGAVRLHVVERGIDPPHSWFAELVEAIMRAAGCP